MKISNGFTRLFPVFVGLCLLIFSDPLAAQLGGGNFVSDPNALELQELMRPLTLDEAQFGCGPLLEPGRTFHAALSGDDGADGRSLKTAWRTVGASINRLTPGDTLVIGEGEYFEPDFQVTVSGEPGRPITVMAAPRQRVVLTGGARVSALNPTAGTHYTFETDIAGNPVATKWEYAVTHKVATAVSGFNNGVWEADTLIELQDEGTIARVEEFPGSYCYDKTTGKLYVHFSDGRGSAAHGGLVLSGSGGLEILGAYLHLMDLGFKHYEHALTVQGTMVPRKNDEPELSVDNFPGGKHVTIEGCSFFMNTRNGLQLRAGARWTLVKNNYGVQRGNIQMGGSYMCDNLFVGNRLESSAPTVRTRGRAPHAIANYGWPGAHVRRNYIVNNIINYWSGFRSKGMAREIVLEGNVIYGLNIQTDYTTDRRERLVVRNNVILRQPSLLAEGPDGYQGNWAGILTASLNNFLVNERDPAGSLTEARFADPVYSDYRLQSDSPLMGKALGGGDIGAYRRPRGRVLFVGPNGNDAAAGTAVNVAWGTLAAAASRLRAGDTLYLLPGDYNAPLVLSVSGRADEPVVVRAHGKEAVTLPGVTVAASHAVLEGLTVARAAGDGFVVRGSGVTLKYCVARMNAGAGIRAANADLTLIHCTLADNDRGLVLTADTTGVVMRDSLLAGNRQTAILDEAGAGWLGSDNLYSGSGAIEAAAGEGRSIVADPLFTDAAGGDYRLTWDSPGAYLGWYAQPAGALKRLVKVPEIEAVRVVALSPESAVVTWATPRDDTVGKVEYRATGSERWALVEVSASERGTVHSIGLVGLKAGTAYEYRVSVNSRRAGEAVGPIATFTATTEIAAPETYYVSPVGDDAADGRSPATAWRTPRQANQHVRPGDTVLVAPGHYTHAIAPRLSGQPERRITWRRHGEGEVIIDGGGMLAPLVLLDGKGYVTVDGFIFTGTPSEHAGTILIKKADGVEILNSQIGYGRRLAHDTSAMILSSHDVLIKGNVFLVSSSAIYANNSPGLLIRDNTFVMPAPPGRYAGGVYSVMLIHQTGTTRVNNNIWYSVGPRPTPQLAIFPENKKGEVLSDYNLFMSGGKKKIVEVYDLDHTTKLMAGATLKEWQASSGQDAHSIQAYPLFVDLKAGDLRLRPGSPAIGAGPGGINIGALGVYDGPVTR